jgi:4-hydroxy-3-polyprenylbenzoate decarboxylase
VEDWKASTTKGTKGHEGSSDLSFVILRALSGKKFRGVPPRPGVSAATSSHHIIACHQIVYVAGGILAYDDLRDWIKALDRAGELKRIRTEADPILEIAEIADRVSKSRDMRSGKDGTGILGGKALLFENIKGYSGSRLLINQFGSSRRMQLALEVDELDEIAERIRGFMDVKSPQGFLDKVKMLPMLAEMGKFFPRTVATGPCKEVIKRDNFSLLDFPILQCWPKDAGRFITLPCVITRDPKTGKRNVGMYRMQIYDERTTGMHWQRQKVAAEHYRDHMRVGARNSGEMNVPVPSSALAAPSFALSAKGGNTAAAVNIMARSSGGSMLASGDRPSGKMEVAVAIGTDPALTFSAIVPAPPDVEEYIVAGFLRQKPVELVKCETVDLEVPANAEIILEGYVNLDELRTEGPFGDHTGFYSLEDEYPVFHVTCVTHRKDPIYATTIVGKPPQEDAWMGKAVERIFLPLMKLTIPELVDINLPIEGVFHNLMIVSIRKSYPGQARKVMNAIWSLGQAMFTKCIIVVDEDVDVQDVADVTLKVLNNIDPERDIQFTLGPIDSLDHAARLANYGSKMGIDATRKWSTEGFGRPWPDEIVMDAKTRAVVDSKWKILAKELGID